MAMDLLEIALEHHRAGRLREAEAGYRHLIEQKPGSYRVWVATAGHPGDLRGKLFAGMAHM